VEQAIFGLVGVLVGGGITWGIEWWRERRRMEGEARVAARLVADELMRAHDLFKVIWDESATGSPELAEGVAGFPLWKEHRAVLARNLGSSDWLKVERAYLVAESGMTYRQPTWPAALAEGLKALSAPAGMQYGATGPPGT
jgi:hypothetical protein